MAVMPIRPMLTTETPITAPLLKATFRAAFRPCCALTTVRELALNCDAHADEAGEPGPYCAHQVRYGRGGYGAVVVGVYPAEEVVVDEGGQHNEDDYYEYRQ